jgi:hypothetical protein
MYRGLDISINNFAGTLFALILCFLFGILTAIATHSYNRGNLMVKLDTIPSFILFLYVFKRKVTLWAVIMQICNYITLISAVIVYKVIGVEPWRAERIFKLIIGVYFSATILLGMLDVFIYDRRKKFF